MTVAGLRLRALPGRFAICRLDPGAVPFWEAGAFYSVTQTADELSVVCAEADVPEGVRHSPGWRILGVSGRLDLALVGVLSALTAPLASAGISVFALSTFDTDYLLVQEPNLDRAVEALRSAGHLVE